LKISDDKQDEINRLRLAAEKQVAIEKKIDELIVLLAEGHFDSETIKQYQSKLHAAFQNKVTVDDLKAFEVIDERTDASREQLLDEFSTLLETHTFNSKAATKYLKIERSNKLILMAIGVIMITLGFAMIIMPAPPYFEMFTIFYFSRDNGVTLMDLISLIIVFAGIYVFMSSLYKKNHLVR
jgi:hypothetical protein